MSRRALYPLLFAVAAAGCGLGVLGSREDGAQGGASVQDGASAEDASSRADGEPVTDATVDAGTDARGPKCDGGRYTDPLSSLDPSSWIVLRDSSNGVYPKIDPSAEGPAVSLVLPGAYASLGSIWLEPPIDFKAFDVSFRYLMTCPDAGGCSDGLVVAWLETTDAAKLQTSVSTSTFGLPSGVRGAAIAFDVHQDVGPNDPAAPSLSVLALDGGTAGLYDWHAKSVAAPSLSGGHDVSLRVRSGVAEVKLDGNVALTGPVSTGFKGRFGFAASSGAQLGTFVIRSLAATFYACDDP